MGFQPVSYRQDADATIWLLAAIDATRGRRFVNDDLAKAGAKRLEFFPEPGRHVFNRRIFEARDFIQIGMIELLKERLHRGANFSVIVKPAARGIDFAFHGDFDFETVPVHPAAFVAFRRVRQSLRRLEAKFFCQANAHRVAKSHWSLRVSSRAAQTARDLTVAISVCLRQRALVNSRSEMLRESGRASACEVPRRLPRLGMTALRLNPALRWRPDELVHLQLKADRQFVRQNPLHNFARIDPAKDR